MIHATMPMTIPMSVIPFAIFFFKNDDILSTHKVIPSVVEWTPENKPYPDERSDQTGYQKLIDDSVCSVDEKTESDECPCESESIPIVYRKSSYPL
jgi:hypothetical protein